MPTGGRVYCDMHSLFLNALGEPIRRLGGRRSLFAGYFLFGQCSVDQSSAEGTLNNAIARGSGLNAEWD